MKQNVAGSGEVVLCLLPVFALPLPHLEPCREQIAPRPGSDLLLPFADGRFVQ